MFAKKCAVIMLNASRAMIQLTPLWSWNLLGESQQVPSVHWCCLKHQYRSSFLGLFGKWSIL